MLIATILVGSMLAAIALFVLLVAGVQIGADEHAAETRRRNGPVC